MSASSRIAPLAEELVAEHGERGLQVAVVRDGRVIAEACAGMADGDLSVDADSLFPVFSVSKGVTAFVAYRAVARGALGFDTPIAEVWPEFAARGKDDIRLADVLDHTAGLARLPDVGGFAQFCDWSAMTSALAAAPVEHRGRVGYHGLTYGWLVGETVRRALGDARGFGDIMRAEVLVDGFEDFWFGIPDAVEPRIVTVARDVEPVDDGRPLFEAIPRRFSTTQAVYGRPDVRRACLPGVNGIGNARTLAAVHARAADGSLVGERVLDEGLRLRSATVDALMQTFVARGLGCYVAVDAPDRWEPPFAAGQRTFGHPGAGGSIAWGDRATGTGFAICRSRLTGDGWRHANVQRLVVALQDAVSG